MRETVTISINASLSAEIERRRGGLTKSAYLFGLIRAAIVADLAPIMGSPRGRPPKANKMETFRRAIARRGEVPFKEFAGLYARIAAPVETLEQGRESIAWAANSLIMSGAFEWTPEGKVRIPLRAPKSTG